MSERTTPDNRFNSFNIYKTTYKHIGTHCIEVNVLVPKSLEPGKHPLFVKWHGGGLTAGTALWPKWFAAYLVPFLLGNNAIAILPNHRLAPEHTGDDMLEDINDFWTWIRGSLPEYIASKDASIELDFSKVLVSGDSAGGWCALQSVFSQADGTFKACFVQYPIVSDYTMSPDQIVCGERIPPKSVLDEFLANIKPGTVISSATPPDRRWLSKMLRAHGKWSEYFGTGRHLNPDTRIEEAEWFVPMYIVHGADDSMVPVEATRRFVQKMEEHLKRNEMAGDVVLVTPPGDHGLETEMYEEDHEWLAKLMKAVENAWLVEKT